MGVDLRIFFNSKAFNLKVYAINEIPDIFTIAFAHVKIPEWQELLTAYLQLICFYIGTIGGWCVIMEILISNKYKIMLKKIRLLIFLLLLVIVLVFAVFFYGKAQGRNDALEMEAVVSPRLILERIKDQYFLVTKTLFFDEEIEIVVSKNSTWKDFLWGEKIHAEGLVRVDIGVDIKKMEASDIDINVAEKVITLKLPLADILDSSLSGELDITTRKGVFSNIKDIFSEDEGADYNKAVEELIRNAEVGVREKSDIFREAREDSRKIIELILASMESDYRIEIVE